MRRSDEHLNKIYIQTFYNILLCIDYAVISWSYRG